MHLLIVFVISIQKKYGMPRGCDKDRKCLPLELYKKAMTQMLSCANQHLHGTMFARFGILTVGIGWKQMEKRTISNEQCRISMFLTHGHVNLLEKDI